jgi:hypothetical protein
MTEEKKTLKLTGSESACALSHYLEVYTLHTGLNYNVIVLPLFCPHGRHHLLRLQTPVADLGVRNNVIFTSDDSPFN